MKMICEEIYLDSKELIPSKYKAGIWRMNSDWFFMNSFGMNRQKKNSLQIHGFQCLILSSSSW